MEDSKIIKLLWQRAEQAMDALAEKFGTGLHRIAMNILSDHRDAEEVVNDTYLAVWDSIPPQKPTHLSAYVYRIGRNLALKQLRHRSADKRSSRYDLSLEELSGCLGDPSLEDSLDARLLGQAIDRFLDTLSKENRALFLRRYWFGDSLQDAARCLGISQNLASVRLHRIRGDLKDYLIKEGFFHEA